MGKKIITFTDIEVENINFIDTKDLSVDDVNINKLIVSNKVPFGEKGFNFFFLVIKMIEKLDYHAVIYIICTQKREWEESSQMCTITYNGRVGFHGCVRMQK